MNNKHKLSAGEVALLRRLWAIGKLTQAELAEAFGINRGQVSRIVRGKSWAPNTSVPLVLQRIADRAGA